MKAARNASLRGNTGHFAYLYPRDERRNGTPYFGVITYREGIYFVGGQPVENGDRIRFFHLGKGEPGRKVYPVEL